MEGALNPFTSFLACSSAAYGQNYFAMNMLPSSNRGEHFVMYELVEPVLKTIHYLTFYSPSIATIQYIHSSGMDD
jgi:hypothetical protein